MERRVLKSKNLPKRKAELFVLVEDRINTRKAMSKENVCTFEKLMNQSLENIFSEKKTNNKHR